MRFDLEINIVDALTSDGLSYISDLFYSDDSEIEPMQWDTKVLPFNQNEGNVNLSSYSDLKYVPDILFSSGITEDSTISVNKIIDNHGKKSLILNGGKYYNHKDTNDLSINTITGKIGYSDEYYNYKLDQDYDIESINIFTLSIKNPGYFKKSKIFKYVEYDNVSINSTFSNKLDEYLFTVKDDIVYLNIDKITYTNKLIGKILEGNRIFCLPEFPANNLTINNINSENFSITDGLLVISKNTDREIIVGEDIVVNYDVSPIITYNQKNRSSLRNNVVLFKKSIDPRSLNFNNGLICLTQTYNSGTIPSKIDIEVKSETDTISFSDSILIQSRIVSLNDVPISNKNIAMEIVSQNAKWQGYNSYTYNGVTSIDGTVSCSLSASDSSIGFYIQKEWARNVEINGVMRGQIILPYRHPSIGSGEITEKNAILKGLYLYTIQSDDPILGKFSSENDETGVNEYYEDRDVKSYALTGRKVAYVKLVNTNGLIQSIYVKPINIEIATGTTSKYRDLYIKTDNNQSIMSSILGGEIVESYSPELLGSKYANGVLPFNYLNVHEYTPEEVTIITYENQLPLSNDDISGMWIASDRLVTIKASYNGDNINLESELKQIKIKSIESELPFVISGYSIPGYDTKVNEYGYLTTTEYSKNPFGIRSCSYYCIFSDCINKKCIHPLETYRKYFKLDSEGIGCIHNPEYDATIEPELRCAGVNAKIVNPFILSAE